MIFWKDFILDDDGLGPLLSSELFIGMNTVRRDLHVTRSRVMEDARPRTLIQETRREAEPLHVTNTGCVRDMTWTQVQAPGADSNLETNVLSHMEVENGFAGTRLRGVG